MTGARWLSAGLVLLVLLAGCGGGAAPVADQGEGDVDAAVGPLLLEVRWEPARGAPSGIRVHEDGRYEYLGTREVLVGPRGEASERALPLAWREQWTFTDEELDALRAAIADADDPRLDDRYSAPAGSVSDPTRATWRLNGRTVVVDGHPFAEPPALRTLYERFNTVRKPAASTSVWRLWSGGEVVERTVGCDVSSRPELRALVVALFARTGAEPSGPDPAVLPPDGTPLADVQFFTEGRPDRRTTLYGDGRADDDEAFTPGQVAAVVSAIERSGFAALPEPIC